MFKKLQKKEREVLTACMQHVVKSTREAGSALIPMDFAQKIAKLEPTFLTIKDDTKDPMGNVQVFATSSGVAAVESLGSTVSTPAVSTPATPKPTFVLETGFTPAPSKRGGGLKGSIYPFEAMQNGTSFFVPMSKDEATGELVNPAKTLGSTVSSANKRFAAVYPATVGRDKTPHAKAGQPTGQDGRKFTVRAVKAGENGEKADGARIYRIA